MTPNGDMHIILIGNYIPDDQVSMQRFTNMMYAGFNNAGVKTEIWYPKVFFGKLVRQTFYGFGKWLGYIDKWIIFPFILKKRIRKSRRRHQTLSFHICDHSNAPYLKYLPADKTVITCHDVLAIQGALGYPDAYCEASQMGKIMQSWILKYLIEAKKLAAVSSQTLTQLELLSKNKLPENRKWRTIHNGFNEEFEPMDVSSLPSILGLINTELKNPFLLHVGSGQPRKNRELLVEMISILGTRWNGKICFAGEGIDPKLSAYASSLGVNDKVISVVSPGHKDLIALYSACEAFIFPSFSEGFGWPLIEAQACGAPVIASRVPPLPEVTGGAAIHEDPKNANKFAEAFLSLENKDLRNTLIQEGFKNICRFNSDKMIQEYINLHGLNLN
jgi:glycosyltransferase involved in cell wall biosynthesis